MRNQYPVLVLVPRPIPYPSQVGHDTRRGGTAELVSVRIDDANSMVPAMAAEIAAVVIRVKIGTRAFRSSSPCPERGTRSCIYGMQRARLVKACPRASMEFLVAPSPAGQGECPPGRRRGVGIVVSVPQVLESSPGCDGRQASRSIAKSSPIR